MKRAVLFYLSAMLWAALPLPATRGLAHLSVPILPSNSSAAIQAVSWTNVVQCIATGASLRKQAGRNDTTDAGANSFQQLAAGDGYVEFTATETNTERYLGFTKDYAGTDYKTIDYALHLAIHSYQGNTVAEVRENGVYKAETSYARGTVFRIAVENGVVNYYRNGLRFYTSKLKPKYPLVVDAALESLNATVSNVLIATTPAILPPPPPRSAPADRTPPILSALAVTNLTATSADITWITNEAANSQVEYGLTAGYGNGKTANPLVTNHRVSLIGLQPNTLYHCRIKAADAAGNLTVSPDFTFRTSVSNADTTPPVLSAIASSGVTTQGATIIWQTDEAANSIVEYGPTPGYGSTITWNPLETTHRITLAGLAPNTTYHYRVKSADAAANQSTSASFVFKTLALSNGGGVVAGLLDDGQVHLPANYTNFPAPQVGVSYADSVYGTLITRLSNGQAQFNEEVHHEYSAMSPFNSDNTRILLATDQNGFYLADRTGQLLVPSATLALGNSTEPRWSVSDPNTLYFHEGNQLKKFDLGTRQKSVVRVFAQYRTINFGGGETDISEDGDHLVILGDSRYVGLYQFSTNTLGNTLDTSGKGGFDYFDVTADNHVIGRWDAQGAGRYKGFELYDRNMNFLRQVTTFGAHADRGRDLDGQEVLFVAAYNDLEPPPGCENNGVEKVRLSDGQRTCLIGLDWNAEIHISANSAGQNPWVLISTTDTHSGTANPPATLPAHWPSLWQARYNELLLVKVDGSETRRIAHHRTRKLGEYWFMPRAAISRDGKFALFDSNLGGSSLTAYTDAFLVNLTNGQPIAALVNPRRSDEGVLAVVPAARINRF